MAVDWLRIKSEYVNGGVSYRELSEKYGVSQSAIRKKAAAEKVEEAKDKIESAREATVPTEIEVKKAARKAGREMKKAADKAVNTVKRTAKKAKIANLAIIIQSPLGGNITVEEIADKVPDDADAVFVRVDQNKLWWTRGDEKGDVDIWE